jgi:ATPase subunit of ABC transporter with duplicated ATPase domains
MSSLLIKFSDLYKFFSQKSLFDGISLSVNTEECFALIGENGSGKTTLLRILAGTSDPDRGSIQRKDSLSIGFLPQEVVVENPHISARQYILDGPLSQIESKMNALQEMLDQPKALEKWSQLHEEFEQKGGYFQIPLEETLYHLGISSSIDKPLVEFSSGQRVRLALVKALRENPDLLLLDEPTNHLDHEMIAWLKTAIQKRKGATIIVSHDRAFLNAVCNRLLELKSGHLSWYGGGYEFYLQEKERNIERQLRAYEEQKEERSLLLEKIRSLTFSKKKPPPPRDKNVMAYDKRGEKHQKSLQHKLQELKARLQEIEDNLVVHPRPKTITGIRFEPVEVPFIELEDVSKSYGSNTLFSHVSLLMQPGSRIVLVGPNGSGKTTFLECVAGLQPFDSGVVRMPPGVKIAYLVLCKVSFYLFF